MWYNKTKGGVDTIDRMLASYSVRRFCPRWPMIVFYNMLDISLINAFALYKRIFSETKRRNFLNQISTLLCKPLLERNEIEKKVTKRLSLPPHFHELTCTGNDTKIKSRCAFCPRQNDKKISTKCTICHKYCCRLHWSIKCPSCTN